MLINVFPNSTKVAAAAHPVYRSLFQTAFPCLTSRSLRPVLVRLHHKSQYAMAHTDPPLTDAADLAHTRNIGIIAHIDAVNTVFLNLPTSDHFNKLYIILPMFN